MPPASHTPNPRGERRSVPRRPSGTMWYGLAFLLLLVLAQTYFLVPAGRQIPYSEFKSLVAQGKVAEATVGEQVIRGTLKPVGASATPEPFVTTRIEDPSLVGELEKAGVKYTGELMNRWLPELLSWIIPLVLLVALWSFFFRKMGGAEGGVMAFARSKAKIYAEDDVKVRFGDVAGVDEAKEELMEIVEFLQHPKKYTNIGGRIPKGVLLVGPPGTGKTLLAKAVAGEAKVPFFSLSGSEFVEMFVGVGAARVRDLFGQAEAKAPCIVFIDELDALGKVRMQGPMGGHEEREQTLNQLLAEMDGFDSRKGVIIMGATNRPEVLDPALLRPGRFDRQVLVDKPDVRGREEILRIHARQVKMTPNVDLRVVAQRTAGFAGADLANLVNEAALLAARRNKEAVEMGEFNDAIDRLIAGLEKKRVMSVRERETVAYHESGHAIVASVLPGLDPVHKISIVQRGFGALGYTMQLPLEDRYLLTRRDLENQMSVLLGGRSAEEIALGEISTGAQNDLQRATDIARAMVTQFGMSEELGTVNYEGSRRNAFLDIQMGPERGAYGEDTAQRIDSEVKRLLEDAHDRARQVINERRQLLEMITRRLLEKEVIEANELQELIAQSIAQSVPRNANLPLHLEGQPRQAALQNRLNLAERSADRAVAREHRVAVQQVEPVDLSREGLAPRAERLLHVEVHLVVARIVERARLVQRDRLGSRAPAGRERACRRLPGDDALAARVALHHRGEVDAPTHRHAAGHLELVPERHVEGALIAEGPAGRDVRTGVPVRRQARRSDCRRSRRSSRCSSRPSSCRTSFRRQAILAFMAKSKPLYVELRSGSVLSRCCDV